MDIKHIVIRVTVVGTHGIERAGLCSLITSFTGFKIDVEAGSYEELTKQVAGAKQLPDICLLHLTPFFEQSYATVQAIKKKWPEMKCIVVSAFDDEYTIMQMLKNGADGYVPQRCEPAELKKALHTIYEKGSYHSEASGIHIHHALNSPHDIASISGREMEFLLLCCKDHTYKEIAELMHVSLRTVQGYHNSLSAKLKIKTNAGLALYAVKRGLASL